ncbi:NEAT domain-containing protein [Paenibacillus thalictri]|uniref:S-layer homology domain-containing protein n=1 Tax=Paenibacillus thalictri TaxID=2527873 RepID=A0A4Q9DIW3_9BACL|nr:NEAT domain-containing protein [Paenibacillus thalictri]TBL73279.1 hypothetical protein EYB31_26735 [Paenibacillus thalictri]
MKSLFKKITSWLLAIVLLVSSLPLVPAAKAAAAALPDGVYTNVAYRYLKDGTDSNSVAQSFLYVANSGTVTVNNGEVVFTHEVPVNTSGVMAYLASRKPGAAKASIVNNAPVGQSGYEEFTVVPGGGADTVKVAIKVEDIRKKIEILMHVFIEPGDERFPELGNMGYDYWYTAQLWLDTSSLPITEEEEQGGTWNVTLQDLKDLILVGNNVHDTAVEGAVYGQYPAGSKAGLKAHITAVNSAVTRAGSHPQDIKPAYEELAEALTAFRAAVRQADKTALSAAYNKLGELRDHMVAVGEYGSSEGRAGDAYAPVAEGEFARGVISNVESAMRTAFNMLQNVTATDTQVATQITTQTNNYTRYSASYFIKDAESWPIYILDDLNTATTESVYASDFNKTVDVFYNGNASMFAEMHANFTFAVPNAVPWTQSRPHWTTEFYMDTNCAECIAMDYNAPYNAYRVPLVSTLSNDTRKVYQVQMRASAGNPDLWRGRSVLEYKVGGETRKVYISYNKRELEALKDAVAAAERLLDKAEPAAGGESGYNEARNQVDTAITAAETVIANLASTRPAIAAAAATLQTAVNGLRAHAEYTTYFTVASGTADEFSPAGVYFNNSAEIVSVTGSTYALVKINPNPNFVLQIKDGSSYKAAESVSEATYKIPISNFAVLPEGQIFSSGHPYGVRLNFNDVDNSALYDKIAAVKSLLAGATVGDKPGQHPESARVKFQQAIDTAGKQAVNVSGTPQKTAASIAALQRAAEQFDATVNPDAEDPGAENPGEGNSGSEGSGTPASGPLADGVYTNVPYRYLKDGTDSNSVAQSFLYVANSGTVTVNNGEVVFTHEVPVHTSGVMAYLASRKPGAAKASIVNNAPVGQSGYEEFTVVPGGGADTVKVAIKVEDIRKKIEILMHVFIEPGDERFPELGNMGYDYWYTAQLWLDTSSLPITKEEEGQGGARNITLQDLKDLIFVGNSVHDAAAEGTAYGQFPDGSKAGLKAHITAVNSAVTRAGSHPQDIKPAYEELAEALTAFRAAVRQADKTALSAAYNKLGELRDHMVVVGEYGSSEGRAGDAYAPVVEGEFARGVISNVESAMRTAFNMLQNVTATDTQVATQITTQTNNYTRYSASYFIKDSKTWPIYILDDLNNATAESAYASDFNKTVDVFYNGNESMFAEMHANFTFAVPNAVPWTQSRPHWTTEFYMDTNCAECIAMDYNAPYNAYRVPLVSTLSNDTRKVYQVQMRASAGNPDLWRGRSVLEYKVGGETRKVYISYNKRELEALKDAVAAAKLLLNRAQSTASNETRVNLETAVTAAETVTANLASARPAIKAATTALQTAASAFDPQLLDDGEYTLDFKIYKKGTTETSVMYDYVDKTSGRLTVEGDKKYVSLALKQSAEILSFKTKVGGVLTETETVSADAATNTRVVRFEVDDLTAILGGWVKIYWNLGPPIGVYDEEYEVDLGFSNIVPAVKEPGGEDPGTNEPGTGEPGTEEPGIDLTKPVPDGEYRFTFTASASGGTPISQFVESGGSLNVTGGKKTAVFTLKPGVSVSKVTKIKDGERTEIPLAASGKKSGKLKLVVALAADSQFSFEVEDLTAKYEMEMRSANGEPQVFQLAFQKVVAVNVPGENPSTNPPIYSSGSSSGGGGGFVATVVKPADGTYNIGLTILKKGTGETSEIMDYVTVPAVLRVKEGKYYITLTLKMSREIKAFKVSRDGVLTDVRVLSSNEAADTREIEFEAPDLSSKLNGWVQIQKAGVEEPQTYEVQIAYDVSSIKELAVEENHAAAEEKQTPVLSDIAGHWGKAAVERAVALGIVNGYEDGSFRPDGTVTRGEFAVMLSRALKLAPSASNVAFADADRIPDWAKPYVAQTVESGIIAGYDDRTFRAEREISRAEIAVMIARALKLAPSASDVAFADADRIPDWAQAQVAAAVKAGIIQGRDSNVFAPDAHATRAESVTLIMRMLNE